MNFTSLTIPSAVSTTPSTATVLTTWSDEPDNRATMAKRWTPDGCIPYDKGFGFTSRSADFSTVERIAATLRDLASDPHSCVIRGCPAPGIDPTQVHWRRTRDRGEDEARTYEDVPRSYMLADIDGRRWSAAPQEGAYAVGLEARASLPKPWCSAACVVRLSASAGMKETTGVHLWYVLDRPVSGAVLRPYLAAQRGAYGFDPALAGAVQPHFTADPIFDGVDDPIPTGLRLAVLDGNPVADVTDVVAFGERAHERIRAEAMYKSRERKLALLRLRMQGRRGGPRATCEEVAIYERIITRVDSTTLYCNCRVHGSRSGESLHVDVNKDVWYCHGCAKGGNAWDLAAHLLSVAMEPTRSAIIWYLKQAAHG